MKPVPEIWQASMTGIGWLHGSHGHLAFAGHGRTVFASFCSLAAFHIDIARCVRRAQKFLQLQRGPCLLVLFCAPCLFRKAITPCTQQRSATRGIRHHGCSVCNRRNIAQLQQLQCAMQTQHAQEGCSACQGLHADCTWCLQALGLAFSRAERLDGMLAAQVLHDLCPSRIPT